MRTSLVLALSMMLGCSDAAPKLVSEVIPGLEVRSLVAFTPGDHQTEILVHEGYIYTANSWSGLGAARLESDGGMTVTDPGVEDDGRQRCTSLALHAPSKMLFCAAEFELEPEFAPSGRWIERFDLSDPAHPNRLTPFPLPQSYAVHDLVVVHDSLLVHLFDRGLYTAALDPAGNIGTLTAAPVEGNARTSVVIGDRVLTLFSDSAGEGTLLRMYEPSTWTQLASLSLAGPPLGLSAAAEGEARVGVALGSAGMQIVDVGHSSLTPTRTLTPPAVVTRGLVRGQLAFAVTLSGVFAYTSNGDAEPRLFGFGPEGSGANRREGNMLDALIHDGELLTSDWTWIQRWTIRPEGEVVALDFPRGLYIRPEDPIRWPIRHVGDRPLRVEHWYARQHLFDTQVTGPGLTMVEFPEDLRAQITDAVPKVTILIRVFDPAVAREGEPLSTSRMTLIQRPSDRVFPPALGDAFPPLQLADFDHQAIELPAGERLQTVQLVSDCWLLMPQFQDLAWLERMGLDTGRGRTLLISDRVAEDFVRMWDIENLEVGLWGPQAPAAINAANLEAGFGDDVFDALWLVELPSGSSSTDYLIDANGEIEAIERMYKGPWSLALPTPRPY